MSKSQKLYKRRVQTTFQQSYNFTTSQKFDHQEKQNKLDHRLWSNLDNYHKNTRLKTFSNSKRTFTQTFQFQPYHKQICGFQYDDTQQKDRFLETKRANIFHKTKGTLKDKDMYQTIKNEFANKKFHTTFQTLKRQILQLENSQIIRKSSHQQQCVPSQQKLKNQWIDDFKFVVNKQFNSTKKVSILQRNRQNIKNVFQNKKSKNYFISKSFIKHDKDAATGFNTTFESSQLKIAKSIDQNSLFKSIECFKPLQQIVINQNMITCHVQNRKNKQTPHIVKRYFRYQSCNKSLNNFSQQKQFKQNSMDKSGLMIIKKMLKQRNSLSHKINKTDNPNNKRTLIIYQ